MATIEKFYNFAGKPSEIDLSLFKQTLSKYSSDKTGYHTYDLIYSALYKDRNSLTNILEMGIHMGASLRAWRDLFPHANIIGLENNPERFFSEEKITSMYVDQSLQHTFDSFLSVMRGTEFDFIIDDGSHYLKETKTTFSNLLPVLKAGGWFVIEDISYKFEEEWQAIADNLGSGYKSFLINMNDVAKTNSEDNIMLVVKKL